MDCLFGLIISCLLGFVLAVNGISYHDEGCKKDLRQYQKNRRLYPTRLTYALSQGPQCDKGGFYRHVQCNWKYCSCNFIDSGKVMYFNSKSGPAKMKISKTARPNLETNLLKKCPIKTQKMRPKNICKFPPPTYPCDPQSKKYIFDGFKCQVAKEPSCYGFTSFKDCAKRCHKKMYDECTYKTNEGHSNCPNPKPSTRYWFNSETKKCVAFEYEGCGGNSNNYESVKACKQSCVATTLMFEVDDTSFYRITLPVGVIKNEKYSKFRANDITLDEFDEIRNQYPENVDFYGYVDGARGDERVSVNPDGSVANDIDEEAREIREQLSPDVVCRMRRKIAPCRAYMLKWYFDTKSGDCKVFPYGGCLPNGNNFKTYGECSSYCARFVVTDSFSRGSKSNPDKATSSMIYITDN